MRNRKPYKSPEQRRAAGQLQLCLTWFAILAPFAALLWMVTLPAGYIDSPLNPVLFPLFLSSMAATFFTLFFAWFAVDAWSRM